MSSMSQRNINCLIVHSDPFRDWFKVTVDCRDTVPALNAAICVAKPKLHGMELELFKACLPRREFQVANPDLKALLALKRENVISFQDYDTMHDLFGGSGNDDLHVLIRECYRLR